MSTGPVTGVAGTTGSPRAIPFGLAVFALAMGLFATTAPPAVAQDTRAHLDAIRDVLRDREEEGMNGVFLLRSSDRELIHEAYGALDRESGRVMTIDAGFDIGSLVKPITAVTVLLLDELGVLSTDDRLPQFFPATPPDKTEITVWQLLTHTSGPPRYFWR